VTGTDEAGGIFIGQIDGPETHRLTVADAAAVLCLFGGTALCPQGILFAQSLNLAIYLWLVTQRRRRTGGIQYPDKYGGAVQPRCRSNYLFARDRAFSANSCGLIAREKRSKKLALPILEIRRILRCRRMAAGS